MVMIFPPALTLPPLGAGVHCDTSELPVQEIATQLHKGNTSLSQSGRASSAGAELSGAS